MSGTNGINFNALRGALYYPQEMWEKREEGPFADSFTKRWDGITDTRMYENGIDVTEKIGGFPIGETEFLRYAKEKLTVYNGQDNPADNSLKGVQDISYNSIFPWADLDFEYKDTDELLEGISKRYDLENAKQGDLCRILSLLVQGGVITQKDYWNGQAIVPIAGTAEDFPLPEESNNLVGDYYDSFEKFVDEYGGAYSENVREKLQISLVAHRKIDLIFQQIQSYRYA